MFKRQVIYKVEIACSGLRKRESFDNLMQEVLGKNRIINYSGSLLFSGYGIVSFQTAIVQTLLPMKVANQTKHLIHLALRKGRNN